MIPQNGKYYPLSLFEIVLNRTGVDIADILHFEFLIGLSNHKELTQLSVALLLCRTRYYGIVVKSYPLLGDCEMKPFCAG